MSDYVKPEVVVSSCLEFEKVRYDGQYIPCDIVKELEPYVNFLKVCPEYEIGLGVPREPIRIVRKGDHDELIQPETGRNVTEEMDEFTEKFLDDLTEVDGFIFKSKSPTVGLSRIKIYSDETGPNIVGKGSGFFARKIIERFKGYPIEDNDRLRNDKIRHHFLTKLFTFSDFRSSVKSEKYEDLIKFFEKNTLLFKLYNPDLFDLVKEKLEKRAGGEDISSEFFDLLKKILSRGYVSENFEQVVHFLIKRYSDDVSREEIRHVRELLDIYKNNKIGPIPILSILKNFALRLEDRFVLNQTIFEPFPNDLRSKFDDDRDKNYWSE